jgi:uncharacterized DUF497 family protein
VHYNITTMLFEWDRIKAFKNLKKHRVSFEIASTIFNDPLHLSVIDPDVNNEDRWVTIGCSANQETLVVVHTERYQSESGEVIRIISARRATRKEKAEYEEGI